MRTMIQLIIATVIGIQYAFAVQNKTDSTKSSFHQEMLRLQQQFSTEKNITKKWNQFESFRQKVLTENENTFGKKNKATQMLDLELETYLYMVRMKLNNTQDSCTKSLAHIEASVKNPTPQSIEVLQLVRKLCNF